MPARRKGEDRQDNRPTRERAALVVVPTSGLPERRAVPKCPSGLLDSSKTIWRSFWESKMGMSVDDVDHAVVERWIFARDEWRRSMNAIAKQRMVEGSMGQPVANPLMAWVKSREETLAKLESQLGIGLKNRADLGISAGQARLTAAALNRMASQPEEAHSDDDDIEEAEVLEGFEAAD